MIEHRQLGRSGIAVSVLGLGCSNLGRSGTPTESPQAATELVRAAIDAGVTLFDTADNYGRPAGRSEEILGNALGSDRDDLIVATKFGMPPDAGNAEDFQARGSRRYIVRAVEASLRRLRTEWIDLYQFHTPDPRTPIDETLDALETLVKSGKVRYFGHSNFAGWQIAEAEFEARKRPGSRFISAQNHYNLLDRRAENDVIPAAQAYGLGVLPYYPLANGLLTGKYSQGAPTGSRLTHSRQSLLAEADWPRLEKLRQFAVARGITELHVAMSWLLSRPAVSSVIAGATTPDQVQANLAALSWEPTAADLTELDSIFPPGSAGPASSPG
ncbi:aldo/keto reductase [Paenarthrobacter sp. Z7-10]|uniref:aldo/keto reductase n=1 Tax=Paenarthrobacter sp. Z7-10 TaxID=2787635 RepID=UPI0022A9B087|nr:aldo/keto reductase [Paenarthrobacter sp. Z7-10]MCZ2403018.1 aldo/keto reductase [Paenarthrobacter sp. Z7-10]